MNRVNLDGRAVHILFGDKGAAGMFIATAVLKQVWRTIDSLKSTLLWPIVNVNLF